MPSRRIVTTEHHDGVDAAADNTANIADIASQVIAGEPNENTAHEESASATSAPVPVAAPTPAPRRRRGGRRVVRAAGAAGAKLQVKIESTAKNDDQIADQAAAAETENTGVAPAAPTATTTESSTAENAPVTRTRTRRRATKSESAAAGADHERKARIKALADELFTDKGIEADLHEIRRGSTKRSADLPEFSSHESSEPKVSGHAARPMTSLLFREPVLPTVRPVEPVADDVDHDDRDRDRDNRDVENDRSAEEPTLTRRRRRRRADRDHEESRDGQSRHVDGDRDRDVREDRADDHDVRDHDRRDADDESGESRRTRRSRRLNAQERRAAAEVEQIEQDLEYDEISYSPIDVESGSSDDNEESAGETRSRRRRRRGSENTDGESQHARRERAASAVAERVGEHERERDRDREEDEEDGTVTRRRRRRRAKGDAEVHEEPRIRRSRKQQYIDEITDIEGSTRLEAKKQRRRDNRRDRSRQSTLLEQDFLARRENVNRLMVVREKEKHTQISVIEDSILVEHYVSDIQEVSTVGNIYLGRVQNVLPSMEAAFVDIGQPRNGVLYAGEVNWDTTRLDGQPRRIELAFKSGDPVLVQVTKDPIGHKGARLTSQVTLAGRFLVLVPSGGMTGVSRKLPERERARLKSIVSKIAPSEMGVIIRTAAEGASKEAIEKDLETLTHQWEHVQEAEKKARNSKRPKLLQGEPDVAIRVVRDIFNDDFNKLVVEGDKVYERIREYLETMAPDLQDKLEKWDPEEHNGRDVFDQWRIDSQLRKGMERKVYLPSGGSLVIDRTEAMTTIDVNTGRFIGKGKSLEETVTRCNLEASEEIARQLRLRDIGGMIMIDYVDMVMPANRDLVLRRLVECLARDRTKHQVAEVTSLGLVQMTRKRVGQGLVEAFSEECPTCKGRGFILHDEPIVSASYDDPYALKGGDPFIKTNKHNQGTTIAKPKEDPALPKGSTPDVKAKLAQIAAAAQAAAEDAKE
ncbi:Rne/Rng family ribonuclease [Bifidobacterium sp. UTCIF-39]|uniref:Rne/Rng family ribonuclease n=1 Tax=Bifidobacterium sp. UTCIF-39 TaxID=1465359 RepID=UPI00112C9F85|nr:Rne/Rng family ribonuclease [Bifidobacterium sp. UTCIF-39]